MRFPLAVFVLVALLPIFFTAGSAVAASEPRDEIYEHANEAWSGDLEGITERRFLRILTVHNPLFFSFDGDSQKGMVAELSKMFEAHLAEEIGRVRSPTVVVIPVARDELIPALIEGRGDLVMGNLSITPERKKLIDFGPPLRPNVNELVITGPAAKKVTSLDDLVNTGLYVRRSSSYFEHIQTLNAKREAKGKRPIPVTEADENLEDYDLLDMVNAGVIKAVIVDSHKADFWAQVFDEIKIHKDLSVHQRKLSKWRRRAWTLSGFLRPILLMASVPWDIWQPKLNESP